MQDPGYLLPCAKIQWREGTPWSVQYQDIYCDSENGAAEKEHVFINGNHLPKRWQRLPGAAGHFCILETGFGFGLSFLQTVKTWKKYANSNWHLHYIAIEKHPLSKADIQRFYAGNHLDPSPLLEHYPLPSPGFHRVQLAGNVHLTLIFDDLLHALPEITATVDAWFLDGFKPATNPGCWSRELFSQLKRMSRPGATLATYSTAGPVRSHAIAEGLKISKQQGYGRKAEMLQGQVPGDWSPGYTNTTNSTNSTNYRSDEPIAIVGAGISGLCLARQFRSRGIGCRLFDKSGPMSGASGIRQLSASPQLASKPDAYSRFSLNAFLFLLTGFAQVMNQSGLQRIAFEAMALKKLRRIQQHFLSVPEFLQQGENGYFCGKAGWFASDDLALMLTDLIEPEVAAVSGIKAVKGGWQLLDPQENPLHQSDHVILATGSGSVSLIDNLPLKLVRGHSLAIQSASLDHILSADISLLPALDGMNTLSGSYEVDADPNDMDVDEAQVAKLLDGLIKTLEFTKIEPAKAKRTKQSPASPHADLRSDLHSRIDSIQVAFRCTSRDRLPVVDGLPDWKVLEEYCRPLRRDASTNLPPFQSYQPGLWVSTAFGSHGMTHIPLCSEYLVSRILDEPWPVSRKTAAMLSATRFAIRDASKQI